MIRQMPGLVDVWAARPESLWEDSGATIPASLNGVVGCWTGRINAVQATTANKPYRRVTPISGKTWIDSNASNSALTATLGNLGSACTVVRAEPGGPYFQSGVTISSTYNLAPAYRYTGDVIVFNRALTADEQAIISSYLRGSDTLYGSLANAGPQIRGRTTNNEGATDFGSLTSVVDAWRNFGLMPSFPVINTSNVTNAQAAWVACSGLTSFPVIDTAKVTNFSLSWALCTGLTAFPLLDVRAGQTFGSAWQECANLADFPASFFDTLPVTLAATCFTNTWYQCVKLTQTSLQNIVVSIAASGRNAPASGKEITLDGAPTLATMQGDTAFMSAVSTLKSRGWVPTYKGTAL